MGKVDPFIQRKEVVIGDLKFEITNLGFKYANDLNTIQGIKGAELSEKELKSLETVVMATLMEALPDEDPVKLNKFGLIHLKELIVAIAEVNSVRGTQADNPDSQKK